MCLGRGICRVMETRLKGESDCLTARRGFSQIIHSNVYKRKQLRYTFLREKINSSIGNI